MNRKWLQSDLFTYLFPVIVASVFYGCTITGTVIDHNRHETVFNKIHLNYPSYLDVFNGDTINSLQLREISSITIDPLYSIIIDNHLYYSASITLKDGTVIGTHSKKSHDQPNTYVSVHNSIIVINGKNKNRIGIENIARLNIN